MGINLQDPGLGNGFSDMTPKVQKTKEKKLDLIKIKNFVHQTPLSRH